jgi:hypothetical protein
MLVARLLILCRGGFLALLCCTASAGFVLNVLWIVGDWEQAYGVCGSCRQLAMDSSFLLSLSRYFHCRP